MADGLPLFMRKSVANLLTQNAMVGKLHEISHRQTFKEVFQQFNKGNGVTSINFEEFKKLAKRIPILKNEDDISLEETFNMMDADASGDVTISEFHRVYTQMKRLKKPPSLEPYPGIDVQDLKGFALVRKFIWITLDTHETLLGRIIGTLMFLVIIFSVLSYCIATVPHLTEWYGWDIIDAATSIIFTIEYALRLLTTGRPLTFLIDPLNMVDLCSFLPFYVELVMLAADEGGDTNFNYFRVLRVCRLMKVIRVSRYMTSYLEIFAETVVLARHSFSMLMSLILFEVTVLSAIMYSLEEEEGTFKSIFEAIYWCVITQTTVGYGDIILRTDLGRMLACFISYAGIFNLTIMVNVMGSCFDEAYTRFLTKEEQNFKKQFVQEVDEKTYAQLSRKTSIYQNCSPINSPKELLLEVSRLNYGLSEIVSTSDTFSYAKKLMSQMIIVRDMLSLVIIDDTLSA